MTNASFHRERITALFQLEVSDAYKNTNYCSRLGGRIPADRLRRKGYSYPVNTEIFDSSITPEMTLSLTPYRRQQIGEWFFQVADHLNVCRDIGILALKFFDTVMTRRLMKHDFAFRMKNRQEYHVLAATCLFIALKLYRFEKKSRGMRVIGASCVCTLGGNGVVTPLQVIEEEREVLNTLEWRMYPPLPIDFVQSFVEMILWDNNEHRKAIIDRVYYMIDLSTLDYFFLELDILPSCVALSALSNGMDMIFTKDSFDDPMAAIASEVNLSFDQEIYELCRYRLQVLWDSSMAHYSSSHKRPRMPSPVSVMCEDIG